MCANSKWQTIENNLILELKLEFRQVLTFWLRAWQMQRKLVVCFFRWTWHWGCFPLPPENEESLPSSWRSNKIFFWKSYQSKSHPDLCIAHCNIPAHLIFCLAEHGRRDDTDKAVRDLFSSVTPHNEWAVKLLHVSSEQPPALSLDWWCHWSTVCRARGHNPRLLLVRISRYLKLRSQKESPSEYLLLNHKTVTNRNVQNKLSNSFSCFRQSVKNLIPDVKKLLEMDVLYMYITFFDLYSGLRYSI